MNRSIDRCQVRGITARGRKVASAQRLAGIGSLSALAITLAMATPGIASAQAIGGFGSTTSIIEFNNPYPGLSSALGTSCSGGCITVPGMSGLVATLDLVDNEGEPAGAAAPSPGGYTAQEFIGAGTLSMPITSGGTGNVLTGDIINYTIFANGTPADTDIQLELISASSTVFGGVPAGTSTNPLYVQLTGTSTAISTYENGFASPELEFNTFNMDWGGTIATTPFAPVPLPASAWLFGSGLLGFAVIAGRRRGLVTS
jgi:hypothetical protein